MTVYAFVAALVGLSSTSLTVVLILFPTPVVIKATLMVCLVLSAILAVLTGVGARSWHVEDERRAFGQCTACGYDLRGSVGRCPECGRKFVRRRMLRPPPWMAKRERKRTR
jgi:hypothetical protein